MKKMMKQVSLRRDVNMYYQETVCWIDASLAVVGKKLKDEDGRHWKVWEVYGSKSVDDLDREYKTWRDFRDTLNGV